MSKGARCIRIADIATTLRVRVDARRGPCRCGCKGQDSWHARYFNRTLTDVQVHAEPVVLSEPCEPVPGVHVHGYIEVARATVKVPWGVEPVRAVAMIFADPDSPTRYADWQFVERR